MFYYLIFLQQECVTTGIYGNHENSYIGKFSFCSSLSKFFKPYDLCLHFRKFLLAKDLFVRFILFLYKLASVHHFQLIGIGSIKIQTGKISLKQRTILNEILKAEKDEKIYLAHVKALSLLYFII